MIFRDPHLPGERSQMACLQVMDRFISIYAKDGWIFSFSLALFLCLQWSPGWSFCQTYMCHNTYVWKLVLAFTGMRGHYIAGWAKTRASLVAQLVKNLPKMRETWVQFLGWEDPLEKGKSTHSSIPAWRIPRTV